MNMIDNSGKGLAALGRNEDRFMAHVAQGEMVVPPVISDNTRNMIRQEMAAVGLNPNEYQVGEGMSINPITGQAEFGFLKKLAKSVKKVVKKIAPIAAVIPGPWQPFAAVYQKGSAALRIAKGEGGLGDIMTLMAGGNQKLTGEGGAFGKIGMIGDGVADNFTEAVGGGFFDSLGNIGKTTDAAGKSSYDLLGYGKNVAKGMASDQKQGYFGAFGGGTGKFNVNTGQMDYFNYVDPFGNSISGEQFSKLSPTSQKGFKPVTKSGIFGDMGGKNPIEYASSKLLPQSVEDALNTGPGQGGLFSGTGGSGINPQMAALALLYGKAVKDAARKTEGGMTDIRQSLRPDLNPQPVYSGFDLGIRGAATGGPINRQYFADGGPSDSVNSIAEVTQSNAAFLKDTTWMNQLSPATKAKITASQKEAFAKAFKKARAKGEGTKFMQGGNNYVAVTKTDLKNKGYKTNELAAYNKNGGKPKGFFEGGLAAIGELDMRDGGESAGPGTGTSDDIPAMLSDGEFVMTAAANNGAGGFQLNKTKKGLELIASSKPNRKKGVQVMNNLMDIFEEYNNVGRMA